MGAGAAAGAEVVGIVANHNGVAAVGLPVVQNVVYACWIGFGGGFVAAEDDGLIEVVEQADGS